MIALVASRTSDADPKPGAALDAIERMGVRETFTKDEEVYGQEEPVERIYRVVSGAVRTIRLLGDGRRQVGESISPATFSALSPGPIIASRRSPSPTALSCP